MDTMKLSEFLGTLIRCSEKAAHIARIVRSEKSLFDLLVEEKTGEAKNKRFVQDFKTLADVLVQETIKHDLGKQFVGIEKHIFGEESNEFTNTLGETVIVSVQATEKETAQVLGKVLDGNKEASNLLAKAVHQTVSTELDSRLKDDKTEVSIDDFGVWIDPIDATSQYIHGKDSVKAEGGVYKEGLQCVVVLIGAYSLKTGLPVVGVMNQPFSFQNEAKQWQGRCLWGVSHPRLTMNSIPKAQGSEDHYDKPSNYIVLSKSEKVDVQSKLKPEFKLTHASGAGYKTLCAVDGLVGAYVLSQGSTFKWDTCGPHAILNSQGSYIADFQKALEVFKEHKGKPKDELCALLEDCAVRYDKPDSDALKGGQKWCNSGGILAFRDTNVVLQILQKLV